MIELDGITISIHEIAVPKQESDPPPREGPEIGRSDHQAPSIGGRGSGKKFEPGYRAPFANKGGLPSTQEIAQSFIREQSAEEFREIEETVLAQSVPEPEASFGVGVDLTTPAFLTDLLDGILNRLQVRLRNVNVRFFPLGPSPDPYEDNHLAKSGVRLSIEDVHLLSEVASGAPDAINQESVREPVRHIRLTNIQLHLPRVVEPPSLSPTLSLATTRRSVGVEGGETHRNNYGGDAASSISERVPASVQSSIRDSLLGDSDVTEHERNHAGSSSTTRLSKEAESSIELQPDPTSSMSLDSSLCAEPLGALWSSRDSSLTSPAKSRSSLKQSELQHASVSHQLNSSFFGQAESPASTATPSPLDGGSLIESRYFSHEEAQSMYQSALEEPSVQRSSSLQLPGGWVPGADAAGLVPGRGPALPPTIASGSMDNQGSVRTHEHGSAKLVSSALRSTPTLDGCDLVHGSDPPGPPIQNHSVPMFESASIEKTILFIGLADVMVSIEHDSDGKKGTQVKNRANTELQSNEEPSPRFMANEANGGMPGAFSLYAASGILPDEQRPATGPSSSEIAPDSHDTAKPSKVSPPKTFIEINVDELAVSVDLEDVQTIEELVQSRPKPSNSTKESADSETVLDPYHIALSVDRAIMKLHETTLQSDSSRHPSLRQEDALLWFSATGTRTESSQEANRSTSSCRLTSASLGYAKEELISVSPSSERKDAVNVVFTDEQGRTELNVETTPLHLDIHLIRIDEAFERFGGLSSLLGMGNSIIAHTVLVESPRKARSPVKPKKARFSDAPDEEVSTVREQTASHLKVNLRLQGVEVRVVSKAVALKLETQTLRLVYRHGSIALRLTSFSLQEDTAGKPRITADGKGIRVDYLQMPREEDLGQLLDLLSASEDKQSRDNEILVDTLLRQRRKGAVLHFKAEQLDVKVRALDVLDDIISIGDDASQLSAVTKLIPDDERPGVLILAIFQEVQAQLDTPGLLGSFTSSLTDLNIAFVGVPLLIALGIAQISVRRNEIERIVGKVIANEEGKAHIPRDMVSLRFIGGEMEPKISVRLDHLQIEYWVSHAIALNEAKGNATHEEYAARVLESMVLIPSAGIKHDVDPSPIYSASSPRSSSLFHILNVDLQISNCGIGLNPLRQRGKACLALIAASALYRSADAIATAAVTIHTASLLVTDQAELQQKPARTMDPGPLNAPEPPVPMRPWSEYVTAISLSSLTLRYEQNQAHRDGDPLAEIVLEKMLLVIETCADSQETMAAVLGDLSAPSMSLEKKKKYQHKPMPIEDLLASLSEDAFVPQRKQVMGKLSEELSQIDEEDEIDAEDEDYLPDDMMNSVVATEDLSDEESLLLSHSTFSDESKKSGGSKVSDMSSSMHSSMVSSSDMTSSTGTITNETPKEDLKAVMAAIEKASIPRDPLNPRPDPDLDQSVIFSAAQRWSSSKNTYIAATQSKLRSSPLKVHVQDIHIIWNLYDGYDWQSTRDAITQSVNEVERKITNKRKAREDRVSNVDGPEDTDTVIGDFLFNSIYIGVSSKQDPLDLRRNINKNVNDLASEVGSYATTAVKTTTSSPARAHTPTSFTHQAQQKKLRLRRSKHHKISIELVRLSLDYILFAPDSGETQSSLDVRVRDVDIFDQIPTSTWRKFATYLHEAGKREAESNMVHLQVLSVKPVPDLAASELVIKLNILPIRLHVDQDALDFITRFFEFKPSIESEPVPRTPNSQPAAPQPQKTEAPSDSPFIQRFEITPLLLRLDYKPKKVSYTGLRSGRATEFMNFFILEDSPILLKHTILYGVPSLTRLGMTLNSIWTADVKRTQLPQILAGLSGWGLGGVKGVVDVGRGVVDGIWNVPVTSYRKDGRLVRALGKGVGALGKGVGREVLKLGVNVAVGAQGLLMGVEDVLAPQEKPQPQTMHSPRRHHHRSSRRSHRRRPSDETLDRWESVTDSPSRATTITTATVHPDDPTSQLNPDSDSDTPTNSSSEDPPSPPRQISLYADQPLTISRGLRSAYKGLARDLLLARDAIIAIPAEAADAERPADVARAVLRNAPTIVLRPAIGVSRGVGRVLMGVGNAVGYRGEGGRGVEDKYKSY